MNDFFGGKSFLPQLVLEKIQEYYHEMELVHVSHDLIYIPSAKNKMICKEFDPVNMQYTGELVDFWKLYEDSIVIVKNKYHKYNYYSLWDMNKKRVNFHILLSKRDLRKFT